MVRISPWWKITPRQNIVNLAMAYTIRQFLIVIFTSVTLVCGQLCKNCEYGCDKETELCTGKCNPGWDGPTCSRRNVALGQRTTQSSVYTELGFSFVSRLAVDGRTGHMFFNKPYTCSHTETNPQPAFWTVTLDGEYSVYRFRIYNRNDVNCSLCYRRLNGFTLSVGSSSQNYTDCYHDTTTAQSGPGNIITKACVNGPIFGDTVKIMITNSEPLTLCEVQIFVCTPGTYGQECENRCGNCAEGPSACNTISGQCPQRTPRCMPGYSGLKCDMACIAGKYGADCEERCAHCADNQLACDTASGNCSNTKPRCMPGYSGPRCDTACYGSYGPDCGTRCGHCAELPTVCNAAFGTCAERTPRCMPGYTGVKCDTECTRGTFGTNCEENCGFCAEGNAACNATSGHCPDREPRCALGYSGLKCSTVDSQDYTGVIAGSSVGISFVLIIGVVIIVVVIRRKPRNAQTSGAEGCGPNSIPFQESSSIAPHAIDRSRIPESSSQRDTCEGNSNEDHAYEAIRQNTTGVHQNKSSR